MHMQKLKANQLRIMNKDMWFANSSSPSCDPYHCVAGTVLLIIDRDDDIDFLGCAMWCKVLCDGLFLDAEAFMLRERSSVV